MYKIVRRIILFFFILAAIILGGLSTIALKFQDEVKSLIVHELNKHLDTEIIIDGKDIDFTIIKNFPYASVDFNNVKALEAIKSKHKDTLFTARSISLQFNVIDIFHENYHIKKVRIEDVNINIEIYENGNDNYHFWKTKENKDTAALFSFALEEIVFEQVHLKYNNYKSKQHLDILIKNSKLSGEFSNDNFSLETESALLVNKINIDKVNYLNKKRIHLSVEIEVDNKEKSYQINKGEIEIEKLLFLLSGSVVKEKRDNKGINIDMGIEGENIDIKSILSLIPKQHKKIISEYKSTGEFYFNASIKGLLSNNKTPQLTSDFGIKDAKITQIKSGITLDNVNLKGHYTNGKRSKNIRSALTLSPFSATINKGTFSGDITLNNLSDPSIVAKIKAKLLLEELQFFLKIDTIESITGELSIDAIFKGKWKNIDAKNYKEISTKGDLTVSNMNAKLKNNALNFTNINGNFSFDNNDLRVNSMEGNVSDSDFKIKGFFRNIIGYALKNNQSITIDVALTAKKINLDELLANNEEDKATDSKYKLQFSENLDIRLLSTIEHLVFRKFEATNIKGLIGIENKILEADQINLTTMDGDVILSGAVDGRNPDKLLLTCKAAIDKINATKLFYQFENFAQASITDKNIKGQLYAKVKLSSEFSPGLIMNMDKLHAVIDMTIQKGELNNVEAMKNLSRFIALKELSNIRFSTLKNSFEIKERSLSFPKMEIKSSAMNVDIAGTHSFDNEIDYKIKLSLNELLSKKAIRAKKQNEEFGKIEDDGLGRTNIFLSMTGTVDDPIIKYDKKEAIVDIKQDIKKEKKEVKQLLKEEFGLFKKDTTLKAPVKKKKQKFAIEWEEEMEEDEKKQKLLKSEEEEDEDF